MAVATLAAFAVLRTKPLDVVVMGEAAFVVEVREGLIVVSIYF